MQQAVERWLRQQATPLFADSIERQFGWFAGQGNARPVLRVKKMRTRWGSLSAKGYINLNMALLHYPPAALDYVVMHELCHCSTWITAQASTPSWTPACPTGASARPCSNNPCSSPE